MSLFSELKELRFLQGPPSANNIPALDRFILTGMLAQMSAAGIDVTAETAEKLTAFYRAIEIISQTVGLLPLNVYKRVGQDSRKLAKDHPLFDLLHNTPNEDQTSMEFREMLQGHLCVGNNAIVIINRKGAEITELVPVNPDRMTAHRTADGILFYRMKLPDGQDVDLKREQVMHIRGRSRNGMWGDSRIKAGADALGKGLAIQTHASKFFANSLLPGGILRAKKNLGKDGRKRLKASWEDAFRGASKHYKVAVLEEDMEWTQITVDPEKAQLIASAEATVDDVSRLTGVPIHMLGKPDAQAYKNVEILSIEFVVYGLLPWLKRWEQKITKDLLSFRDRKEFFVEFSIQGLLRGDTKTRHESYRLGRQWGWYSVNDIRRFENENPIGDKGDIYLSPMNMIKAETVLKENLLPKLPVKGQVADPDEEKSLRSFRETRVVQLRMNVRKNHRKLFEDAFGRIVTRENKALRDAVEKYLNGEVVNIKDFDIFVRDFYLKFRTTLEQILGPVYETYAQAIDDLITDEIGDAIEEFVPDTTTYTSDVAIRYTSSSRGQLQALLGVELVADVILQRLGDWNEKRVSKEVMREVVDADTDFSTKSYQARGVGEMQWETVGDSCPLCNEMQGRTVSTGDNFLDSGATVDPNDGETTPLKTRRGVKGPQLHGGCDCLIVAKKG